LRSLLLTAFDAVAPQEWGCPPRQVGICGHNATHPFAVRKPLLKTVGRSITSTLHSAVEATNLTAPTSSTTHIVNETL